jgi:hypothetical protein
MEQVIETELARAAAAIGCRVVVIECGAGMAIPRVRVEGQCIAERLRAILIRINSRDSDVPEGGISLPLPALAALERIAGKQKTPA